MEGWVLGLALFFTVLLGVIAVLLMKVLTTLDIVVRAIPLGAPKVQERRPPQDDIPRQTRPVGGSSPSGGRHG